MSNVINKIGDVRDVKIDIIPMGNSYGSARLDSYDNSEEGIMVCGGDRNEDRYSVEIENRENLDSGTVNWIGSFARNVVSEQNSVGKLQSERLLNLRIERYDNGSENYNISER